MGGTINFRHEINVLTSVHHENCPNWSQKFTMKTQTVHDNKLIWLLCSWQDVCFFKVVVCMNENSLNCRLAPIWTPTTSSTHVCLIYKEATRRMKTFRGQIDVVLKITSLHSNSVSVMLACKSALIGSRIVFSSPKPPLVVYTSIVSILNVQSVYVVIHVQVVWVRSRIVRITNLYL